MTILTNDVRGHIVNAVLKHGFAAKLTLFLEEEKTLLTDLYVKLYKPEEIAAMTLLDQRFRQSMNRIFKLETNAGGCKIHVGALAAPLSSILPRFERLSMLVVADHRYDTSDALAFDALDELGIRITGYAAARTSLTEEVSKRQAEVSGVLRKANTDGQLQILWPEVMPIARQFIKAKEKPSLPMVPTAQLNDALGLPPGEMKLAA